MVSTYEAAGAAAARALHERRDLHRRPEGHAESGAQPGGDLWDHEWNARTLNVLCIGAHPDDVELGCGGTLARFADRGHQVHALVMSDGQVGGDSEVRNGEALRGARALGIHDVTTYDLPDTRLSEYPNDIISAVERKVAEFSPDIIFTHSPHDLHQDHQAVHLGVLRGARNRTSIMCFESPSATKEFMPLIYFNVQDYLETKIRAIQEHENQSGKSYMDGEHVRLIAAYRGRQAKIAYAEAFEPIRVVLGDRVDF